MKQVILILFLLISSWAKAQTTRMDSMQSLIQTETDTMFFDEWAMYLADAREFNTIERNQLLEWFLDRTIDLNLEDHNARFKFRKSIAKTITGDYKEALDLINEALPIFKKNNDALWQAACYNSAGGMIAMQGNLEQGIEYLEKAIALVPFYEDSSLATRSLSNHYTSLGNIYANNKQIDSALKYINLSYGLAKKAGEYGTKERCFGQLNLAKIYNNSNNYRQAIHYAFRAQKEADIDDYEDIKCFGIYRMAIAYEGLKMYDSAYHFYDKALEQSETNDLKHTGANILKSKAYLDLKAKRFESAAQNFEKYNRLRNNQILRNQSASVDYLVDRTKEAEQKRSELEKAQIKIKEELKQRNLRFALFGIIGLLAILSLSFFIWFQRRKLKEQIQQQRLEKELIKTQMRAINSQMNPHFVFNALNSVQDLIMQKDIRNSNIYMGKFAELMRKTLEFSKADTISLAQELETVSLYLDLEKLRFGDNFVFRIENNLNEGELEGTRIPSLLLQPYAENAIKHGLLHKKGSKELIIRCEKEAGKLKVSIRDNGVGRAKSEEINKRRNPSHVGFASTANEQRIKLLKETTGKDINLIINDLPNQSGTEVILIII